MTFLKKIIGTKIPVILLINKIDTSKQDILEEQADLWQTKIPNAEFYPISALTGFNIKNVYCLPGVPSILKSMLGGLNNKIIGGKTILSKTLSLRTVESEISIPLEKVQKNFKNLDIGSYPFFKQGKIGVSLVMRSKNAKLIEKCTKDIIRFIKKKRIKIITNK